MNFILVEEYSQNVKDMKLKMKEEAKIPQLRSKNPLDNLDCKYYMHTIQGSFYKLLELLILIILYLLVYSNEFKTGTYALAKLLRIPRHPNHLVTLKACSKLVQKRLNPECLRNPNSKIVRGKPFPIMDINAGFQLNKPALENAAKILALLYIQDIRNLQTKINEAIVRVQSITANPKTDTKLGKVGK